MSPLEAQPLKEAPVLHGERDMAKRKTGTRSVGKKRASARELIDTGSSKRYVRRGEEGQFKESDEVGKSLTRDRATKAKTKTTKGQGDRGDRKPSSTKSSKKR